MSKKMMKRSLALGALMAFVITGSAMAAEDGILNSEINNFKGGEVVVDTAGYIGGTEGNRTYALGVNDGKTYTLVADETVTLVNKLTGTDRNYGIAIINGSSLIIKGNVNLDVEATDGTQARAVRNSYGKLLQIDGNLIAVANTKKGATSSNYAVGIDNWNDDSQIVINGNSDITAIRDGELGPYSWNEFAMAVQSADGAVTTFNGDTTSLKAVAKYSEEGKEDARTGGAQAVFVSGEVNFNSTTKTEIYAESNYSAMGIQGTGKATFANGDVDVKVINHGNSSDGGVRNAIGVISNLEVKDSVNNFSITVEGIGEENTNPNHSNGTAGIYAYKGREIDIYAQNLKIAVTSIDKEMTFSAGSKRSDSYGIKADDTVVDIRSNTIIDVTDNGSGRAYGVYGEQGADIDLADTTITATSKGGNAYGIYTDNSTADVTGDLTITATGYNVARGVEVRNGSKVTIGDDEKSNNVTINAVGTNANASGDWVIGVFSRKNGSEVDVKGDSVTVSATATGTNMASGILANTETTAGVAKLNIEANNIVLTADAAEDGNAVAITTMSGSEISIKGNLTATADKVIYTRGNAKTVINESGNDTVVLNGDIAYAKGYTDNDEINATVEINFGNAESEFNGAIYTQSINGDRNTFVKEITNGTTLKFSNGATWKLTGASVVNNVTFGADSVLNLVDGSKYTGTDYALNAGGGNNNLTVEEGAKLQIGGIAEGTTYNIAQGFGVEASVGENWTIDNNLMTGEWSVNTDDGLQVKTVAKKVDEIATDMGVDSGTASALGSIIAAANNAGSTVAGTPEDNVVKFAEAIANAPAEQAADAANAVVKMAEAGGNSATAANIVKNVTGVTNDRLSFNCGHSAPHKGGHGVGLFEEGSGADIWVEYVHGKDEVEDMKSTAGASSYEGQYNGIVMGVDFKKVGKFQSGVAFNYGEGDTNSVGTSSRTHSDYDFWGIGYYGNIHNDDSNVIFDVNYAKTDSDVTNYNTAAGVVEASPETTTWTAGVKVEKLYQNENVQIVPYTGLRYMSIDPDDYKTKCGTYSYSMDRQDIWLLPVGVSIRQEVVNDNGWTVSPRVDLSYIWAFGDTDSNMEFATALNTKTNIGYDVMDDGSFLGLVGIEAHKGQWGYGVAYSYQKGDHSTSKKWYVDVNYSF